MSDLVSLFSKPGQKNPYDALTPAAPQSVVVGSPQGLSSPAPASTPTAAPKAPRLNLVQSIKDFSNTGDMSIVTNAGKLGPLVGMFGMLGMLPKSGTPEGSSRLRDTLLALKALRNPSAPVTPAPPASTAEQPAGQSQNFASMLASMSNLSPTGVRTNSTFNKASMENRGDGMRG